MRRTVKPGQITIPDLRGLGLEDKDRKLRRFADQLLKKQQNLDFKMSAKGWKDFLQDQGEIQKCKTDKLKNLIHVCLEHEYLPSNFTIHVSWDPQDENRIILTRAMEHIKSVPYKVSVRWVCYRLLQDGILKNKDDFNTAQNAMASARKNSWREWRPWTLEDQSREMIPYKSRGDRPDPNINRLIEDEIAAAREAIDDHIHQSKNYRHSCYYGIDPNYYQDYFFVIMYEAKAMTEQFKLYTKGLTLIPSGGYASISYKWDIAKYIEEQCKKYQKSSLVLYFGDSDPHGENIYEVSKQDIINWCNTRVDFKWCGLGKDQAEYYGLPRNPDPKKKDNYQWEALTDSQAKEIIKSSLEKWYDFDAEERAWEKAKEIQQEIEEEVNEFVEDYIRDQWKYGDENE